MAAARIVRGGVLAVWMPLLACAAPEPTITPSAAPVHAHTLPLAVGGRVQPVADGGYIRQWPGTYFETAFRGSGAWLKVGPGEVALRVAVDGVAVPLVKPQAGFYRLGGLGPGPHRLRVDVVSESQAGPTDFGGVFADARTAALPEPARAHQIEFIGDSHTVGYGNRSSTRQCTEDAVWGTTDTADGLAALTARRFDADYQVNAISGRGVVRNYGGFAADTLPQAYPFVLFDKAVPYRDARWHPQVIVIALGTNDFTTPLHAGERWPNRDALHADFEATYVRFVQALRARNPQATFVLWATDMADGEIEAEVRRVVDRLHAAGETRVGFVPIHGLQFGGCNMHPNLADDRTIADALAAWIGTHVPGWRAG